jgi:acyl carrier protein
MSSTVARTVTEIIAAQCLVDVADLAADTRLADIGMDSLSLVETIFAIEEAFDVDVPFNTTEPQDIPFDTTTVGSVIAAVEGLVARKAA